MYTAGWGATVSEIKTERAATSANKGKARTIRIVIVRSRLSNHRSLGKGDFFFHANYKLRLALSVWKSILTPTNAKPMFNMILYTTLRQTMNEVSGPIFESAPRGDMNV